MAFIPISEEQFLKIATPAAAAYDDEDDKKQNKKKLYDELSKIKPETDNAFEEYMPPTDSEIEQLAAKEAEDKISGQLEKYLSGAEAAKEKLLSKKTDAEEKVQNTLLKAGENYQKDVKQAANSAIKKGIARSSIIEGIKSGIDKEYIKGVSAAQDGLSQIIDEIEKSLFSLESEKKAALSNFDLNKGLEIQKNIEKLQAEREKKIKAAEKESLAAQKAESDFLNDINSPKLKERAQTVLKFYDGANTAADLQDFTSDQELKKYLGAYYDVVHAVLTSRHRNK